MLWTHNGRISRFLTSNEQYFSYIYGSMTGTGIAHINEKSDNTEIKDNYWYTGMWGKFTLQRTTTCIPLSRNESGRFGALKSDSTHHFFRNACTKSGSLRFSQFSGC
jgi:hypothetical protein